MVAEILDLIAFQRGVFFCMHHVVNSRQQALSRLTNCAAMHKILAEISHLLGVPLKEEKAEGHATAIVFLGLELDTVEGTVSN